MRTSNLRLSYLRPIIVGLLALMIPVIAMGLPESCEHLANLKLRSTTIVSAVSIAAGAFKTKDGKALADLKAFCRVVGIAQPTPDSRITFEV